MAKKIPILIIDYGLGNLNSVARGISAAGATPLISQNPNDLKKVSKAILPGVGAFAKGMDGLKKRKFITPILNFVESGNELIGLCLGMQLLYEKSTEFGVHKGLGLIKGTVSRLNIKNPEIFKIPHVGWNSLKKPKNVSWNNTILEDVGDGDMVYFVHSYAPPITRDTLAQTEYGKAEFCSVVKKNNITGTQFHPEKSADVGQKILRIFISNEKKNTR